MSSKLYDKKDLDSSKNPEARELREIANERPDFYSYQSFAEKYEFITKRQSKALDKLIKVTEFVEKVPHPLRGYFHYEFKEYLEATRVLFEHDACQKEYLESMGPLGPMLGHTVESFKASRKILDRLEAVAKKVLGAIVLPDEPHTNDLGTFQLRGDLCVGEPRFGQQDCHKLTAVLGTWRATVTNSTAGMYHAQEILVELEGCSQEESWEILEERTRDESHLGFFCSCDLPEEENYDSISLSETMYLALVHPVWGGVSAYVLEYGNTHEIQVLRNTEGKVCAAKIVFNIDVPKFLKDRGF